MHALNYLLVAIGGAFGALLRYQISLWFQLAQLPLSYATLLVNVLGSFFFGAMIFFIAEKAMMSEQLRLFLLVGFAGAFTTFSTFSYEMVSLMQVGQWLLALSLILANVLLSLMAFALAFYVAKQMFQ